MYLRAGYSSKLVDREARDQLVRLQLALEGSIFERTLAHCCCAIAIASDDQLVRLQLVRLEVRARLRRRAPARPRPARAERIGRGAPALMPHISCNSIPRAIR
jgi:hypothetical protein